MNICLRIFKWLADFFAATSFLSTAAAVFIIMVLRNMPPMWIIAAIFLSVLALLVCFAVSGILIIYLRLHSGNAKGRVSYEA